MKKGILLVLIFICHSDQRPQLDINASTSTTETTNTDTSNEPSKSLDKILQVVNKTTAAAVSVQTSLNVSSYSPSEIFEDFEPSNYYRPDGNPIFEKPSPQMTHEVFYNPQYFKRPNHLVYPLTPPKTEEKNIVFPKTSLQDDHNFKQIEYNDNNNGLESRSPHKVTEAQFPISNFQFSKPMKHDSGEIIPIFNSYDNNLYERHFGKYHGKETSHYPANIIHEPPNFYHSVIHKKKDPWKSVLSFFATILPVGLLLASFPPTVIKVNSTQYPYQFQKNATSFGTNDIIGRFKALREKNAGRKINEVDELFIPHNIDNCLKKKICENVKINYSPIEIDSMLQNNKLNWTGNSQTIVEIAEVAVSTRPESCQTFVCGDRTSV